MDDPQAQPSTPMTGSGGAFKRRQLDEGPQPRQDYIVPGRPETLLEESNPLESPSVKLLRRRMEVDGGRRML